MRVSGQVAARGAGARVMRVSRQVAAWGAGARGCGGAVRRCAQHVASHGVARQRSGGHRSAGHGHGCHTARASSLTRLGTAHRLIGQFHAISAAPAAVGVGVALRHAALQRAQRRQDIVTCRRQHPERQVVELKVLAAARARRRSVA
eukprot:3925292-Prymnesium_polylepis.1